MSYGKNDHVKVIKEIALGMNVLKYNDLYLELGIRRGACFNQVSPLFKKSVAVDTEINCLEAIKGMNNFTWWHGTTDSFFKQLNKDVLFDMIFIDADHCHESSQKDFINSLNHIKIGGLILLHDTYPHNEQYKGVHYCNDTYKTAEYITQLIADVNKKSENDDSYFLESCTLPIYSGITIVRKFNKQLVWDK